MQSLVHHVPGTCTICGSKFDGKGKCCIRLNMQDGCVFCPECLKNGKLKSSIVSLDLVPFGFVSRELKFYRKSQNAVESGSCESLFVPFLHPTSETGEFGLRLFFSGSQRYVSLSNIFKHNPEVYQEFLTTKNLLGDSMEGVPLAICANDLSVANIDKIDHSKNLADSTEFDKFDF
jgi:hypothetical protein